MGMRTDTDSSQISLVMADLIDGSGNESVCVCGKLLHRYHGYGVGSSTGKLVSHLQIQ